MEKNQGSLEGAHKILIEIAEEEESDGRNVRSKTS